MYSSFLTVVVLSGISFDWLGCCGQADRQPSNLILFFLSDSSRIVPRACGQSAKLDFVLVSLRIVSNAYGQSTNSLGLSVPRQNISQFGAFLQG